MFSKWVAGEGKALTSFLECSASIRYDLFCPQPIFSNKKWTNPSFLPSQTLPKLTQTPEASMSSSLGFKYQNEQKGKTWDNSDTSIPWNWWIFHYEHTLSFWNSSLFTQTFHYLLINICCQIIFSALQWNVLSRQTYTMCTAFLGAWKKKQFCLQIKLILSNA